MMGIRFFGRERSVTETGLLKLSHDGVWSLTCPEFEPPKWRRGPEGIETERRLLRLRMSFFDKVGVHQWPESNPGST